MLRSAAAVLAGGIIYSALTWVPLVGPFATGVLVGWWTGGGFLKGLRNAAYAASLGSIIVFYMIAAYGLPPAGTQAPINLVFLWMLLIWNVTSIIVAGAGGGIGALSRDVRTLIPTNLMESLSQHKPRKGVEYRICPSCGQGNVESAKTCIGCAKPLK